MAISDSPAPPRRFSLAHRGGAILPARATPLAVLLVLALCVAVLLFSPTSMPVGAMFWDTHLYLDAANRMGDGQLPHRDFFAPVGALGYWATSKVLTWFPDAHPVLAASWSVLIVTVPLMALVVLDTLRNGPKTALILVVPFALFSLLPFNTSAYYPLPGSDGFGIDNRHGAQLLYVLACALLFMRSQLLLTVLIAAAMFALFWVKITAFLVGALLCAVALATRRVHWTTATTSVLLAGLALGGLELTTGMLTAYLGDIVTLFMMNEGRLSARIIEAASRGTGTIIAATLFTIWLIGQANPAGEQKSRSGEKRARLDHAGLWMLVALVGGVIYESQNIGSQDYIFLIPVCVYALREQLKPAAILLASAVILPLIMSTAQHGARAIIGTANHVALPMQTDSALSRVTARADTLARAQSMRGIYLSSPEMLARFADSGLLPSPLLFADFDFQALHLMEADAAASALQGLEAQGMRYETIMTLDFANPFGWMLDKPSPRALSIAQDPLATVPALDDETRDAVARAHVILEPLCPWTDLQKRLLDHYRPALEGHRRALLTNCYAMWLHPDIQLPR